LFSGRSIVLVNALLQTTKLNWFELRPLIDLVRTAARPWYTYLYLAAPYFKVSRFALSTKSDRLKKALLDRYKQLLVQMENSLHIVTV
jgi:hypothetical protein